MQAVQTTHTIDRQSVFVGWTEHTLSSRDRSIEVYDELHVTCRMSADGMTHFQAK